MIISAAVIISIPLWLIAGMLDDLNKSKKK
jgi:hypothetical protein